MIALALREHARVLLYGSGAHLRDRITLDEARLHHAEAVGERDDEAIALWARVIWRLLADERRYGWLREPVRPEVAPRVGDPVVREALTEAIRKGARR